MYQATAHRRHPESVEEEVNKRTQGMNSKLALKEKKNVPLTSTIRVLLLTIVDLHHPMHRLKVQRSKLEISMKNLCLELGL